jgi:phosphate-selective porin OprO and OprP
VLLSYAPENSPFSVTIGNFDTYQSLEQPTSSRYISFLERAQMNEAFDHTRRLGIGLGYASGDLRLNVGLFNDRIRGDNDVAGAGEGSFGNDDWLLGARAVWAPKALGGQLHLGANYQHRAFDDDLLALNYRQRPFVQTTDQRFAATGGIAAEGDDVMGVEAAGIFGPLHVTAEAQRVEVDAISSGETLEAGQATTGTRYDGDPVFKSAYAELGYWLTGETRGYKNGLWDRTRVLNGFDDGGWGALQIVGRIDWLDLRDRVAAGTPLTAFTAPNFVNGGIQTGYLLALNWQPIDYVRFTAQYTRAEVEGGPRAATVAPGSTEPIFERDFGVDIFALRAQFDF